MCKLLAEGLTYKDFDVTFERSMERFYKSLIDSRSLTKSSTNTLFDLLKGKFYSDLSIKLQIDKFIALTLRKGLETSTIKPIRLDISPIEKFKSRLLINIVTEILHDRFYRNQYIKLKMGEFKSLLIIRKILEAKVSQTTTLFSQRMDKLKSKLLTQIAAERLHDGFYRSQYIKLKMVEFNSLIIREALEASPTQPISLFSQIVDKFRSKLLIQLATEMLHESFYRNQTLKIIMDSLIPLTIREALEETPTQPISPFSQIVDKLRSRLLINVATEMLHDSFYRSQYIKIKMNKLFSLTIREALEAAPTQSISLFSQSVDKLKSRLLINIATEMLHDGFYRSQFIKIKMNKLFSLTIREVLEAAPTQPISPFTQSVDKLKSRLLINIATEKLRDGFYRSQYLKIKMDEVLSLTIRRALEATATQPSSLFIQIVDKLKSRLLINIATEGLHYGFYRSQYIKLKMDKLFSLTIREALEAAPTQHISPFSQIVDKFKSRLLISIATERLHYGFYRNQYIKLKMDRPISLILSKVLETSRTRSTNVDVQGSENVKGETSIYNIYLAQPASSLCAALDLIEAGAKVRS